MNKLKAIRSPYMFAGLLIGAVSFMLMAMSPYADITTSLIYIVVMVGALILSNLLSKKAYVLTRNPELKKRVLVYAGLALFISAFAVVFSSISQEAGFVLDYALYMMYRILFYTSVLFTYYYIDNEIKRLY